MLGWMPDDRGMQPTFRVPFKRDTHVRELKRARGIACYGALVAHFGTESPKLLELRVDERGPYDFDGDQAISNKYLRWRQGKALPHDASIAHVAARSGGSVKLGFWRDLPLWELLHPDPPSILWIHRMLEGGSLDVRRILFLNGLPERFGFSHSLLDRSQTLAIRNLHSLEAFMVLLAMARKGEQLEDDPHHYLPSACAFDILPRVLYRHAALRYRWEGLFGCLERIFWNRIYINGAYYLFPIERVRDGLQLLEEDPSPVPPNSSVMQGDGFGQ